MLWVHVGFGIECRRVNRGLCALGALDRQRVSNGSGLRHSLSHTHTGRLTLSYGSVELTVQIGCNLNSVTDGWLYSF